MYILSNYDAENNLLGNIVASSDVAKIVSFVDNSMELLEYKQQEDDYRLFTSDYLTNTLCIDNNVVILGNIPDNTTGIFILSMFTKQEDRCGYIMMSTDWSALEAYALDRGYHQAYGNSNEFYSYNRTLRIAAIKYI